MRQVKFIAIVTALIFLLPAVGFSIYRLVRDHFVKQMLDEKFHIDTIIQTGLVKEALPTIYLTELLELSCDRPGNFFTFDINEATKKLLSCPIIKEVRVEKRKPSTIYIDYQIRTPIAILSEFTNTAIDREGFTFAMAPFFSPAKLPEIFLDLKDLPRKIEGEKIDLALSLYNILGEIDLKGGKILKIDVANAFHKSYGKREIVLTIENSSLPEEIFNPSEKLRFGKKFNQIHILRMSTINFKTELQNYLAVKDKMGDPRQEKGAKVLDLRIAKLAFIEDIADE